MTDEIQGTVLSIIYEGADGYIVAEIEADEPTIVVGNMPDLKPGERSRFFGVFKNHPRFGLQFAVQSYESALPKDLNDIALFLGGGFIRGLGEILAMRIVEQFGEDTFDVIENDPALLAEVKGVSKRLAGSVHEAFLEYSRKKYVYTDLMGMGLTAKQATAITQELGDDAARIVRGNPYVLIDTVYGIDFKTADKIAMKIGIEHSSPFRIKNGILNVLKKLLQNGSTFVFQDRLTTHVSEKINVDQDDVLLHLLALAQEKSVVLKTYYPDLRIVMLYGAYQTESRCGAKLFAMSRSGEIFPKNLDALLAKQTKLLTLTDEQANAVYSAVTNRVCVITGGPGTGKTTILKAVLNIFGGLGQTVSLAAPTGRAAKRMTEATGAAAQTLHRLLEYSHDEDAFSCRFRRNEENPLEEDVIIVDEVSMLDIFLLSSLLCALKDGARLILVGDKNQLPSVGAGNVMGDITQSEVIPVCELTYRFRNAGGIADAAYEILNGNMPAFDDDSFVLIPADSVAQAQKIVCDLYADFVHNNADVQVLAPIKRTELGTHTLCDTLRERVNPPHKNKQEITFGDRFFREGDRVMQIKNNYAREWSDHTAFAKGEGVFNGDIGMAMSIRAGKLAVSFEDQKTSEYELPELPELESAFAYTIHKSQGSEFDVVLLPMLYETMPFFTRNLLYTAVTRAKKKVILVGTQRTLRYMIQNKGMGRRWTILEKELKYLQRLLRDEA